MQARISDTKNVSTDDGDGHTGRPADCDCLPGMDTDRLGCWPCFREGYETANPDATLREEERDDE